MWWLVILVLILCCGFAEVLGALIGLGIIAAIGGGLFLAFMYICCH